VWPPTWEQSERAAKFVIGVTWASLELAFWGARPSALAFITTVLAGSEVIKLAKGNRKDEP
jgi:hypothetical protein